LDLRLNAEFHLGITWKRMTMLNVLRSDQNDTYRTRKHYKAGLQADVMEEGRPGWIRISFATNPGGLRQQCYQLAIVPNDFEMVAHEMLRADPEKAIKAFGAAMQDFEVSKP
jgi:hypothetical protein